MDDPASAFRSPAAGPRTATGGAWHTLRRSIKAHPVLLACWGLSLLISCGSMLALPLIVARVVDSVRLGDQALIILAIIGTVLAVSTAARFYSVTMIGEYAAADLKSALLAHLLRMDGRFYDSTKMGELTSRMTTDVGMVRFAVGGAGSIAIRCMVTGFGATAVLIISHAQLALYVLLIAPAAGAMTTFGARSIRSGALQLHQLLAEAFALAGERLSANHVVRAFGRESYEAALFHRSLHRVTVAGRNLAAKNAVLQCVTLLALGLGITLTLRQGALLVASGEMSQGALAQFGLYVGVLLMAAIEASHAHAVLQRAKSALEHIDAVLKLPTTPETLSKATRPPSPPEVIFADVSFSHHKTGKKVALDRVSFQAPPGKITALIGPSGSGKSTILALVQRFYPPAAGLIHIGAHNLQDEPTSSTRSLISVVPQFPTIFRMTAAENIGYGNQAATRADIIRAATLAGAASFIEDLPDGYDTILGPSRQPLSVGQAHRLAIARALVSGKPLLLLDEPTSALDAQSEISVVHALRSIATTSTVILATHRPSIMMLADHVVLLEHGRVVLQGSHATLLDFPQYQQIAAGTGEWAGVGSRLQHDVI